MDRTLIIAESAQRTMIYRHIEKHNVVKCKDLSARISVDACEQNQARAYLTKQRLKVRKNKISALVKTVPLFACLECKRYKKPGAKRISEVILTEKMNFGMKGSRRRNDKEGSLARASSVEGIIAQLYDKINEISSSNSKKGAAIKGHSRKYRESTQSNDIFDVGIPVEIDEDEM